MSRKHRSAMLAAERRRAKGNQIWNLQPINPHHFNLSYWVYEYPEQQS